ncbi:MAG: FAD-dependent oxidoreductase [Thermoguttaceae bacterium]
MIRLSIDHRPVEVPPGATVLAAAWKLGIDVPALCFREGSTPSTSCLVCMVKLTETGRFVPACATAAAEGLEVESETAEVHQLRRDALELLLSDHLGDCLAPCFFACPARMDIPRMLRQIAAGDLRGAIATVKRDIALPAVLGRVCPTPCERACRRGGLDAAVAICQLKRYVADVDLASGDPYVPWCGPATGRRVAILGAGPTGLSAAYYLAQQGHACTMFDENRQPGGRLRQESPEKLPPAVLDAEIGLILRLGVEFRPDTRIDHDTLADIRRQFDAVLIASPLSPGEGPGVRAVPPEALHTTPLGIAITKGTFATSLPGVFAAGTAVHGRSLAVRSVADGKAAAAAIGRFLAEKFPPSPRVGEGPGVRGPSFRPGAFSTKIGRMDRDELLQLSVGSSPQPRVDPPSGEFTAAEATAAAGRCMHCDCRGLDTCKLRHYAAVYGADPRRYKAPRRRFQQDTSHPEVLFEPGKCIACGLCIEIAASAGETLGLSFIGRGFDVRLSVPLDGVMAEALAKSAAACVAACPTAALAWKKESPRP